MCNSPLLPNSTRNPLHIPYNKSAHSLSKRIRGCKTPPLLLSKRICGYKRYIIAQCTAGGTIPVRGTIDDAFLDSIRLTTFTIASKTMIATPQKHIGLYNFVVLID
mmetsp:Transcript_3330/g.7219  ORF Transcript_3330/g.7219 Transcript_3330/m.7219 type:complete len:106 (+) Transcript_3330:336-653(+)